MWHAMISNIVSDAVRKKESVNTAITTLPFCTMVNAVSVKKRMVGKATEQVAANVTTTSTL